MNVPYLKNLGLTLAKPHTQVLQEMREEIGVPAHNLAADTGLDEPHVREILRSLRELGVVNFGFLMSEDQGELMGSGYWLEDFGSAVAYLAGVHHGLVQRRELALLCDSHRWAHDHLAHRHRAYPLSSRRPLYLIWHQQLWHHGTIITDMERLRGWELNGYLELGRVDRRLVEMAETRVR